MLCCPRCNRRLVRVKTAKGIFYECPGCRGRAISLAVVRRVVQPKYAKHFWQQAISGTSVAGAACPACGHTMAEIVIPNAKQPLHLDVCRSCQFMWFDPHELERLPKQAPPAPPKELPQEVREKMAIADTRLVAEVARRREIQDATHGHPMTGYALSAGMGGEGPDEAWKWVPAMLGFPVEHDINPIRSCPWITWGVAATMILITSLTIYLGNIHEMALAYGFIPAEAERLGGLTFVTAFFLHAGILHLVGNTYFLLIFGDNVEDHLGRLRYLLLLAAATVAGDLLHALSDPRSMIPCIGASGGISGVLVYYALRFPKARLGIIIRYWAIFHWIHFPAYVGLIMWLGMQFLIARSQLLGETNISALAHLGGASVGLAAWLLWRERSCASAAVGSAQNN